MPGEKVRLDDLYQMIAYIYGDKIIDRSASATFLHFVEVCGMLTAHDRKKKREGLDVTDALCKAMGWYFPLLNKLRMKSVEHVVFRKFPNVCPYCRSNPHDEEICKQVRGTKETVDHEAIVELFDKNWNDRPVNLDDWQAMFQKIYPRSVDDSGRSTIGLLEELGELAEAIRVFELHPEYFMGEAADTFSYIMGIANEHKLRLKRDGVTFSFQQEFMNRYPGLCTQCGSRVCSCPPIPEATIGRMAKELSEYVPSTIFIEDPKAFAAMGKNVAHNIFEEVGGYAELTAKIPFDRGDANRALVKLCLKIAKTVEGEQPAFALNLMSEAYQLASSANAAGSKRKSPDLEPLLSVIKSAWQEFDEDLRTDIKSAGELVEEIGDILDVTRVLYVFCSPQDETSLRLSGELRAIKDSLRQGRHGNKIKIETLPSATPTDLRRELLNNSYEIVHFAGHANSDSLVFEKEDGSSSFMPIEALGDLVKNRHTVNCVILNACESISKILLPISNVTIGMDKKIDDDAAIAFSTGFYDALAAGKNVEESYREGVLAVKLAGAPADYIRMLK